MDPVQHLAAMDSGVNGSPPPDVPVDVRVDGNWVRGRAHKFRQVESHLEVLVTYAVPDGDQVAAGWFASNAVRPVHADDEPGS
ncbi:MAG: hypothetical protein HOQ45_03005 [Nocardioidaceae bacterium]|nr:hypothetical protein [Nocardioidaceae bacterium]